MEPGAMTSVKGTPGGLRGGDCTGMTAHLLGHRPVLHGVIPGQLRPG